MMILSEKKLNSLCYFYRYIDAALPCLQFQHYRHNYVSPHYIHDMEKQVIFERCLHIYSIEVLTKMELGFRDENRKQNKQMSQFMIKRMVEKKRNETTHGKLFALDPDVYQNSRCTPASIWKCNST